MSEPTRFGYKG